jgi:CO/xanthine dehydrogenase FAD-binding subunit
MRTFTYERAATAQDALRRHGAGNGEGNGDGEVRYLGGGTNLVDLMRLGVEEPARLVDVSHLPYDTITEEPDGGLLIGSAVRNSDLASHRAVRERFPILAQAVLSGGSGQIRNMATVGGNLLQRTRCSYFQDITKPCNKRVPGTGCPAREGEHHNLAILGHSRNCVATHPSDMAVALSALGAHVRIMGRDGERTVPLVGPGPEPLYRLPGTEPHRDTTLEPGELITGIEVRPMGMAGRYRKVRERASFAFALVSIAVAAKIEDGTVQDLRLALGGVAHQPWRAFRAEDRLRGTAATQENFIGAAEAELSTAEPLRDNAYKVKLTRTLIVRTLMELAQRQDGERHG